MRSFFVIIFTLAMAAGAGAGCKSEPSSAAGKTVERDQDSDDDQAAFDRERQPAVIIKTLGLKPGDVVADIGAGSGLLTVHVARAVSPGGRVIATDIDGGVLDLLHSRMVAAGFGELVEGRVVKPAEPGLDPGGFDAILLAQVDHYFDDRVTWLTKAAPALKPGGRIAIANRLHHKAAAMAAARTAGFRLVTEVADIPGQFVAVFEYGPPPPVPTKDTP